MSVWNDMRDGLRRAILLQDRVERMAGLVQGLDLQLTDHERRLVRIETMIELAQQNRLR